MNRRISTLTATLAAALALTVLLPGPLAQGEDSAGSEPPMGPLWEPTSHRNETGNETGNQTNKPTGNRTGNETRPGDAPTRRGDGIRLAPNNQTQSGALPGDRVTYNLTLHNDRNRPLHVQLFIHDAPEGWCANLTASEVRVPGRGSAAFQLYVHVPWLPTQLEGTVVVAARLADDPDVGDRASATTRLLA